MTDLTCFGKPCNVNEWLACPERVLKHFRKCDNGVKASEINRRRWGSPVPLSYDVEQLKACKKHGLVSYENGLWFYPFSQQDNTCKTR